jgi:hypothetical protein
MIVALALAWQGRALFAALLRAPRRVVASLVAVGAALLSAGYIVCYLRGAPRIIDATSYWLQARALSEGHLTWPIHEPTASVRGRFLLMSGSPDAPRVGVIFPPGYPLVLSLGFLIGHPLWVGPILAALLAIATYALARRVAGRDDVALLAALFSALCATLRYHTADTMSHGWAALLFTSSLAFVYAAKDDPKIDARCGALAGVAAGWLFATRPLSAIALIPALLWAGLGVRHRARAAFIFGLLPPLAFFLFEQRAVTGSYFHWSQAAYYALADGPPGCFRYGFGVGIGCLHEHGDYVASVLPHGLDLRAALITTLRRVHLQCLDIANSEPLSLLALVSPIWSFAHRNDSSDGPVAHPRRAVTLALGVVALVLAYVPFYFDGSYPGGGARLLADVLPLEHVLLACSVAILADRFHLAGFADFPRWAGWALAACLLGFGVRTSFEHIALRDREGGRPFFVPSLLAKAHVDRGLLFTGTDHAFNLAYDPNVEDAAKGIVVSREYGDDRDRLVWERLGRPPSYRYWFNAREPDTAAVVPWSPGPVPHPYRFEAEAEWPPLAQSGGQLEPIFARGTCAWGGRLLAVRTESKDEPFRGTISFPVPFPARYRIGIHVASRGDVLARFALRERRSSVPIATWVFVPTRHDFGCSTLPEVDANLSGYALIEVSARQGSDFAIDAVSLEPIGPL